jgi:hypothetical protein
MLCPQADLVATNARALLLIHTEVTSWSSEESLSTFERAKA